MRPERYRQIGELYHAALKLAPDERSSFLEQACADDPTLKSEVESLIASHERSSDFIKEPALAVAAGLLANEEITELIGQSLGRYRVLSLIGTGGMGRVYLAEDTLLGRRVALKLLPKHFTNDKDQVLRFRQEARAASALNHPGILTVHEVGQVNGTEFIATEYVAGETLRARLSRASLRINEALEVATQVADALVAAHEAGIIHRDIKPENVMIRGDGYVKVLDFGLAKLTENLSVLGPSEFESPTRPAIKTNPGVVMGTAEYMSPEQARGLPVDVRTDVWSLGVVIYEMLAGRRPFSGPTHGDTIVSILEREPTPLLRYATGTPPELDRIVTKAFRKDANERYQTVKDMASDLRRLKRRLEAAAEMDDLSYSLSISEAKTVISGTGRRSAMETEPESESRVSEAESGRTTSSLEYLVTEISRHKRGAVIAVGAVVLLFGGLGYGLYRFVRHTPTLAPFQTTKVTRVTASGWAKVAAISPDGKYVVYAEENNRQQSLWVRQVATGSSVQIVSPIDGAYWGLTFSNDSNYVYYVKNEKGGGPFNKLYRVPSLGGASKKLMDQVDTSVAFSPDGSRLAFVRDNLRKEETEVVLANPDGTAEQTVARRKAPNRFASDVATRIAWSPNGKSIACAAMSTDADGDYHNAVEVSVEDGSEKPLTLKRWAHVGQVAWLSDGSGLVMVAADESSSLSSAQLWHLSYPSGETRLITNDLNRYTDVSLTKDSNTLVTVQKNQVSSIWVAPTGDPSRAKQITSGTNDTTLSWTADGKIVYWTNASGTGNVWVTNADGSNAKQLTHDGQVGRPTVSADGRHIFFSHTRARKTNIWRMDANGQNQVQLTDGKSNYNAYPSPDGRWIVYISRDQGNGTLWKIPIDGGTPLRLSEPTVNLPVVSPDGKWIACFYWDEQANPPRGVTILPFERGAPTKRFDIRTADGFVLHWTTDGRALLYIHRENIWSQVVDGGEPTQLTDFQGDQLFSFDFSPDGKWLAIARGRVTDDVVMISDLR